MRAMFVLVPAIFLCALTSLLSPTAGIAALIATIYLGIELTEPRPERGEISDRAVIAADREKNK